MRRSCSKQIGRRFGYNTWTVPFFGLAVMEELSGAVTGTIDPFLEMHAALGGQDLQPHQAEAIALAEALLDNLPDAT